MAHFVCVDFCLISAWGWLVPTVGLDPVERGAGSPLLAEPSGCEGEYVQPRRQGGGIFQFSNEKIIVHESGACALHVRRACHVGGVGTCLPSCAGSDEGGQANTGRSMLSMCMNMRRVAIPEEGFKVLQKNWVVWLVVVESEHPDPVLGPSCCLAGVSGGRPSQHGDAVHTAHSPYSCRFPISLPSRANSMSPGSAPPAADARQRATWMDTAGPQFAKRSRFGSSVVGNRRQWPWRGIAATDCRVSGSGGGEEPLSTARNPGALHTIGKDVKYCG